MPRYVIFTVLCLSMILSVPPKLHAFQAVPGEPPDEAGVYFKAESGEWSRLLKAAIYDSKNRGVERFVETEGYSYINSTAAFDGEASPFQLASRRPVFFIRGMGKPKDVLIAALTRKTDRREVRYSTSHVASDNKAGIVPAAIRRVKVTVLSPGLYSISPEENLKPGEYIILFADPGSGFDFGVTGSK
jgi:hypothetical protein